MMEGKDRLEKGMRSYVISRFVGVVAAVVIFELLYAAFVGVVFVPMMSLLSGIGFVAAVWAIVVFAAVPVAGAALLFERLVRARLLAQLRAADAEREKSYARRNLMLSDMAHDLRTPVMGISGLARALADGMVDDEPSKERYLRSIAAKSEKMGDLATMLFDYISLESEGFKLDRKRVDVPQLLLAEAAALYQDAEDAGMALSVEVSEEPAIVRADEKQMARVVSNLLTNAIRHNPPGTGIVLGLVRRAGAVQVVVADTGAPIEGDAGELFEPFTRGDAARSGVGSGLGLSIAKTIVDMHGYDIRIEQPYGAYAKAFVITCAIEL